ncbi:MAG: hypothetical protein Q8Q22_01950 [bacterium]|nr:hypothetical protein [bacterium]
MLMFSMIINITADKLYLKYFSATRPYRTVRSGVQTLLIIFRDTSEQHDGKEEKDSKEKDCFQEAKVFEEKVILEKTPPQGRFFLTSNVVK